MLRAQQMQSLPEFFKDIPIPAVLKANGIG